MSKKSKKLKFGEFFVEQILDKRIKNRKAEYLIKWKDYDSEENSWEPEKNLDGCLMLKKKFEENFWKKKAIKNVKPINDDDSEESHASSEREKRLVNSNAKQKKNRIIDWIVEVNNANIQQQQQTASKAYEQLPQQPAIETVRNMAVLEKPDEPKRIEKIYESDSGEFFFLVRLEPSRQLKPVLACEFKMTNADLVTEFNQRLEKIYSSRIINEKFINSCFLFVCFFFITSFLIFLFLNY